MTSYDDKEVSNFSMMTSCTGIRVRLTVTMKILPGVSERYFYLKLERRGIEIIDNRK